MYKVDKKRFKTLDAAIAYANLIFKKSGVIVGIERASK